MSKLNLFLFCCIISLTCSWEIPSNLPELKCESYDQKTRLCIAPPYINTGFYWNTSESIVTFTTFGDTRNSGDCQIYITASQVYFILSNLTSCEIYINASKSLIISQSTLSTSGSFQFGKGYTNEKDIGNSYAGFGGFCSNASAADFTYGDHNTSFKDSLLTFGSGGPNYKGFL